MELDDEELRYTYVPGEIDLHDYTTGEALAAFIQYYNREVSVGSSGQIDVVHGYGSSGAGGTIRTMLRSLLKKYPDKVSFVAGENFDKNAGHTLVYAKLPLPTLAEHISDEICGFCTQPKTEEKIVGEFRTYGVPEIKQAVKTLERQRRLSVVWKGKHKCYEVGR